jgi:hypothetical protein
MSVDLNSRKEFSRRAAYTIQLQRQCMSLLLLCTYLRCIWLLYLVVRKKVRKYYFTLEALLLPKHIRVLSLIRLFSRRSSDEQNGLHDKHSDRRIGSR